MTIIYRLRLKTRILFSFFSLFGFLGNQRIIIPFTLGKGIIGKLKFLSYKIQARWSNIFLISSSQQRFIFNNFKIKLKLLPPSIPYSFFENISAKRHSNDINISFVGRIDERKGCKLVIKLFKKLNEYKSRDNLIINFYGIKIESDKGVNELENKIKSIKGINYFHIDRKNFSEYLELQLRDWLDSTDYFIQPYSSISSTVDTPLLLLEAMSRNCNIFTTQIEQASDIVGVKNTFPIENFVDMAFDFIISRRKFKYNYKLLSPIEQANILLNE